MENKFYQKWWFWVCIVVILCVVLVSIFLINKDARKDTKGDNNNIQNTKYDNEDEIDDFDQEEKEMVKKIENLKRNINIETLGITKNGDFAFRFKNNNNEKVFVTTLNTLFKDSAGNVVEKVECDEGFFVVGENSELILKNDGDEKDYSKYTNWEFSFELEPMISEYVSNNYVINNIELANHNTQNHISVEIKNKNSIPLKMVNVLVAYYKDNQIVGCVSDTSNDVIEPNGLGYINIDYPEDKEFEPVNFDRYEVYLLSAEK